MALSGEGRAGLLALPRELRDQIYDHAFREMSYDIGGTSKLPGLLTANRQLYAEAMKPFFNLTTFRFGNVENRRSDGVYAEAYLKRMPTERFAWINRLEYRYFHPEHHLSPRDREGLKSVWERYLEKATG